MDDYGNRVSVSFVENEFIILKEDQSLKKPIWGGWNTGSWYLCSFRKQNPTVYPREMWASIFFRRL